MTLFNTPSNPARLSVAGVVTIALLLCLPDTGFAAQGKAQTERGESLATALHSAGLLARGAGYGSPGGSKAVREVQRRLSRLGHEPGPIDGLLGPLTEGAILRFQMARGLAVDGVVGPQTKASLASPPPERPGRTSKPKPSRPAGPQPSNPSAGPNPSRAPSQPLQAPPPTAPEPSAAPQPSEGMAPAYAALLGALGAALVLSAVWALSARRSRRRSPERRADSPATATRLNFGVVCAALLGVFAAGAAGGAAFATRAAPDADEPSSSDRGVAAIEPLGAGSTTAGNGRAAAKTPPPSRPRTRSRKAAPSPNPRPSPKPPPDRSAPASTPFRSAGKTAPASEPATSPEHATSAASAPQDNTPSYIKTYTVRPGDALWPIAEHQLSPGRSTEAVARRVRRIAELNPDRFLSGDPNMLVAGEELRLP